MNALKFHFCDVALTALPSGALWMERESLLCVSDLHLGKSDRWARRSGMMLPPYETQATLDKLGKDIAATDPATVVCLGDSFDDLDAAQNLSVADAAQLGTLQAGRAWIWIEGNHDPGPIELAGSHRSFWAQGPLVFRHICSRAQGEISGHYHPKYAPPGTGAQRACFLYDKRSLILPAYGAYTGGLGAKDPALARLMDRPVAILTGHKALAVPVI